MTKRARTNRGGRLLVDPKVDLAPADMQRGIQAYDDWHWGNAPTKVVQWDDPDMPDMLVQCGQLIRMHVRAPRTSSGRHPRRERDAMIEFSREVSAGSHIAFDPNHPYERLYLLINPRVLPALRRRFWDENPSPAMPLGQLAALAGGRHGRGDDYLRIYVKPVGILTAIVYSTDKKRDGLSYYIHHMGEISHHYPVLAVDQTGRLWLAGGDYTSPNEGIKN